VTKNPEHSSKSPLPISSGMFTTLQDVVAFWLRPSGYGTWGSFSTIWDVVIDPLTSSRNESRVSAFIEDLVGIIGDADRAGMLRDYCLGLLLPGERKRIERRAVVTARACR